MTIILIFLSIPKDHKKLYIEFKYFLLSYDLHVK